MDKPKKLREIIVTVLVSIVFYGGFFGLYMLDKYVKAHPSLEDQMKNPVAEQIFVTNDAATAEMIDANVEHFQFIYTSATIYPATGYIPSNATNIVVSCVERGVGETTAISENAGDLLQLKAKVLKTCDIRAPWFIYYEVDLPGVTQ